MVSSASCRCPQTFMLKEKTVFCSKASASSGGLGIFALDELRLPFRFQLACGESGMPEETMADVVPRGSRATG